MPSAVPAVPPAPAPAPNRSLDPARLGLFSTLTGAGSRALVTAIAGALREGEIPNVTPAFLFVNREAGESADTDASVAAIAREFDFPIIRASATRFQPEARKAARGASAARDEAPLWAWRDAYYASYRDRLPATDLDLLLGDMWIWGRRQCTERHGVNLHPALPSGPLGKMWFDVIWDLVAMDAVESGVMLHRVTPEVDEGPVVSTCRYSLRGPALDPLWALVPPDRADRLALVDSQRLLRREATHPLFHAIRAAGLARELPLMLETLRSLGAGRLTLAGGMVRDASGWALTSGLDLTDEVERWVGEHAA
jgi:phosphoribosylglycinamide formyltransferase-1